ncbi:MAG: hypothetical protein JO297_18415 [Nitrososphaeraceae archaeon]|nr:hypothetical protein [Nitrososphaeraceae archaeon]
MSKKGDKLTGSTKLRKKMNVVRIPVKPVRVEEAKRMISSAAGQLASGFPPIPNNDLIYHHGKLIPDLSFFNFYVGKSNDSWNKDDKNSIDSALAAAMSDKNLNNVMVQYFPGRDNITSTFRGSQPLSGDFPERFFKDDIESLVNDLFSQGKLDGQDLNNTVFNFMLPSGTMLNEGLSNRPSSHDSSRGLGGYHGSVHVQENPSVTIYYAIGVFSEILNGGTNGIAFVDSPWKNIVTTFYHELNEARTNPDVEDADRFQQDSGILGWYCDSNESNNIPPGPLGNKVGGECGDIPMDEVFIFANGNLSTIVKEVQLTDGTGIVPVQFQYSNAVHGPEGPISTPHTAESST